MNLINAVVTEVLSEPTYITCASVSWWEVKVKSLDMGGTQI